eukprot:gnl/TRDRNA2_/TRDRNA2_176451_c1_seq5.p1 gnl/TRDRNA2_/TRDRNA2_176451_c1~~gnl/TRDRNA2_/TRDRNA2_176451_c1_seq5.p1  ORF type:complete len:294 (+),score=23.55 gnl/TRDRNA2_/TRDRNA2_176451_c1_seq5:277-1158(+)
MICKVCGFVLHSTHLFYGNGMHFSDKLLYDFRRFVEPNGPAERLKLLREFLDHQGFPRYLYNLYIRGPENETIIATPVRSASQEIPPAQHSAYEHGHERHWHPWMAPATLHPEIKALWFDSQANFCREGILDKDGKACCPLECGMCGGPLCADMPGGSSNCCPGSFYTCQERRGPPPCIYHEYRLQHKINTNAEENMFCLEGILDKELKACCPKTCRICGDQWCVTKTGFLSNSELSELANGSEDPSKSEGLRKIKADCCGVLMHNVCKNRSGPPPCRYDDYHLYQHDERQDR